MYPFTCLVVAVIKNTTAITWDVKGLGSLNLNLNVEF